MLLMSILQQAKHFILTTNSQWMIRYLVVETGQQRPQWLMPAAVTGIQSISVQKVAPITPNASRLIASI